MLKKAISVVTMACMLSSVLTFNVFAKNTSAVRNSKRFDTTISTNSNNPRKPGQLIVKYKNNTSFKANKNSITKNEGKILKSDKNGLTLVQVDDRKLTETIKVLEQNNSVEYVAPNYIRKALDFPQDAPDDPRYEEQWGLKDIKAPEAWATLGDTSSLDEVVVAVIDTGLDMKHEDLKDRVTKGYDFVDMDNDPSPEPYEEEHATHVAGIIAASTDNGIGVAGTAGKAPVKIMPLRVLEAGSGDDFTIAQAINYAADNGAKVINMSLGGYGDSPVLTEACNYAFSKNVVVVASSGNSAMDAGDFSPASIPGVITVAATDINNALADFSNFGASVELSAPGVNVLSSLPGDIYEAYSGTSMAAPFVSAACALLLSKNPSLSLIEVEQYLTDSAQDLGDSGKDETFGYGLLDLNQALNTTKITPRLEIMSLADKSTVYDVVNVQTRFTYPEKIVTTELYIDGSVVDSVYNDSNNMFTNFEIDTYKYSDGNHTLKVVANDTEKQTYSKEIKINVRNTVYTGLRVKLTQDGTPVSGGYLEVYNKYSYNGQTYYDYCYSGLTSSNGVAVIPGSSAPNGNEYVIVANYSIENGDELSSATLIEEATAPGVIEINGDDLVPVTVDTGLTSTNQYLLANYKFPGTEQSFGFLIPETASGGSFDTFLDPGTYSFEAYGLPEEETGKTATDDSSTQEPLYLLKSENVEIDSGNFLVTMDSDIGNLAKVDLNYKNIHGFIPQLSYISVSDANSMLSVSYPLNDLINIPEIYATPGDYSYFFDITGSKDGQLAYIGLEGIGAQLEAESENLINFGGTFTGKVGLDKTKFIPGEDLNINSSVTDSYGNRLVYMDYLYEDPFLGSKGKNLISNRSKADKVEFRAADTAFKALEDLEEPVEPEEPIEIEYKSPATLTLVDSNNNVIKSEEQYSTNNMFLTLPQSLATGKYKLKLIMDLPYLIQAETALKVDRVIKNNAVKFTIELPDKTKATSAYIEVIDPVLGYSNSYYGEDLLNGEMYIPLPKGNYKFIVTSSSSGSSSSSGGGTEVMPRDSKFKTVASDVYEPGEEDPIIIHETAAVYVKDGKSPANYSLSPTQLQEVEFAVKDEDGKIINNLSSYYFTIPLSETFGYQCSLGYNDPAIKKDIYITKGTYNFGVEVLSEDGLLSERIIFNPNVAIGLKTKNTQVVEFTSDNLTEVALDSKTPQKTMEAVVSDPKTGFNSYLYLMKGKTVKVSKGLYTMDFICESPEYGSVYLYLMTAQKDFTGTKTNISCEPDFSMTITPSKSIYKTGETLKTTNVISDRFGNRVIDMFSYDMFSMISKKLHSSKGKMVLRKDEGKIKLFDLGANDYVEIPYYDIRAPFIKIKDSFDDVIFSAKSPDFYTKSAIKLDSSWIDSGTYKLEWTLDIDADGDMSAESSFKVK